MKRTRAELDWIDTIPQGDPDVVVMLPNGERLIALHIRDVSGYPMLPIRLDPLGRPVSVAREDFVIATLGIEDGA